MKWILLILSFLSPLWQRNRKKSLSVSRIVNPDKHIIPQHVISPPRLFPSHPPVQDVLLHDVSQPRRAPHNQAVMVNTLVFLAQVSNKNFFILFNQMIETLMVVYQSIDPNTGRLCQTHADAICDSSGKIRPEPPRTKRGEFFRAFFYIGIGRQWKFWLLLFGP